MVVNEVAEDRADALLHALADATRRDILRRAMAGRLSVSGLARQYPISVTAVQKHVDVLQRAGLVAKQRQGREVLVRTQIEGIRTVGLVLADLQDLWRGRVDRMDELLADPDG